MAIGGDHSIAKAEMLHSFAASDYLGQALVTRPERVGRLVCAARVAAIQRQLGSDAHSAGDGAEQHIVWAERRERFDLPCEVVRGLEEQRATQGGITDSRFLLQKLNRLWYLF